MKLSRPGRLAALFVFILIELSCGDTYRPVAVPQPPTPANPGAAHYMLVLTGNGPVNPGATLRLDTSGDTAVAQATTGEGPVSVAVTPNQTRTYIANSMNNTVSSFASSTPTSVTTTALVSPTGTPPIPVFVDTTENGSVYVADYGDSTVDVISIATNVVTNTIPVGTNPVSVLETGDSNHLYTVNLTANTVTSIDPVSRTVRSTIPVGTSPTWILQRSDNQKVYVLNSGSGTVTSIDTLSDTATCGTPSTPVCPSVGAGANYMFYDALRNRLYVTNPVSKSVVTLNVAVDPPSTAGVPGPVTLPLSPTSVTALNDGSRVYAVSFQKGSPCTTIPGDTRPCIQSQVTVLNAMDMSLRSTIPLQSTVNITSATQDAASGSTTFAYTVTSGAILQNGMTVVISGMSDAGNNGTFVVAQAFNGTFTVTNPAGVTNASQSGTGISVVEVDTTDATGCDVPGLGVPGGMLGGARFRLFIAASADAKRIYAANCDAGSTTVIRTVAESSAGTVYSPDTVVLNIVSSPSAFPPSAPGLQPPPQNPFYIFASP